MEEFCAAERTGLKGNILIQSNKQFFSACPDCSTYCTLVCSGNAAQEHTTLVLPRCKLAGTSVLGEP